jgi:hypothetical protein
MGRMAASITVYRRFALATVMAVLMFLNQTWLQSYFVGPPSNITGSIGSAFSPIAFGEVAFEAQAGGSAGARVGRGCTTVWYIDEDCDGYGPGVRSSGTYGYNQLGLGDRPDADDTSATLNTFASVVSAYDANSNGQFDNSELKTFLFQRKSITADNIIYVSTTGNNSTAAPDNPSRPYASYGNAASGVHSVIDPGDVVIYRAGTYVNPSIGGGAPVMASGSAGNPIVFMSMPGEAVNFQTNSVYTFNTTGFGSVPGAAWVIIDGFTVDNPTNVGLGNGWGCSGAQNTIIRNIETQRFAWITCVEGHDNLTVERLVVHHQSQHGLYMGANTTESTNITVQDSIFYANGYDHASNALSTSYGGHQFNGRCTGCLWQRNISHTNSGWGFSLIQGVHKSTIRNNLLFNNGTYGVIMQIYPGSCAITGSGPDDICPYDTNSNLFVNNTIWVGTHRGDGYYGAGVFPELFAAIGIARNTDQCVEDAVSVPGVRCSMEQTFRNNVFYTSSGPIWRFEQSAAVGDTWIQNSIFENNVIYKTGNTTIATAGATAYTFAQFESNFGGTNRNSNPLFELANTADYGSPGIFSFKLQPGSPARDFGTIAGAPPDDLTRTTRISPPDAGAYEYAGATTTAPQAPTNLRIIR